MTRCPSPSSLTPREREILESWEAGSGSDAISKQLGMPKKAVARIISVYVDNDEERRHRVKMHNGSEGLLAAIERERRG